MIYIIVQRGEASHADVMFLTCDLEMIGIA
jgi:hypothetical protein